MAKAEKQIVRNDTAFLRVRITALSPMMHHRFQDAVLEGLTAGVRKNKATTELTPREKAREFLYTMPHAESQTDDSKIQIAMPTVFLTGALKNGASNYKVRGSRKSLARMVAGAVQSREEYLALFDARTKKPLMADSGWEVDMRRAVNANNHMPVCAIRPKIHRWECTTILEVNTKHVDLVDLRGAMDDAGTLIGVGAYRPQNGGPYGRFSVTEWTPLTASEIVTFREQVI